MTSHPTKVPNPTVLQLLISSGQTPRDIAGICNIHVDTVRQALRRAGLINRKKRQPSIDGPRSRAPQTTGGPPVELLADRIVLSQRVTAAGCGGSTWKRIALARVTVHADALREEGRC